MSDNVIYEYSDISSAKADIIVNASNGVGWMGGKQSIRTKCKGVAESLNFHTKGEIEKEALVRARKSKYIFSFFYGHKSGEMFFTSPCGLNCTKVLHAVTMRYAGCKSRYPVVYKLIKDIFEYCDNSKFNSIAIPLLGTGVGGLDKEKVKDKICSLAKQYPLIKVHIYGDNKES